MEYTTFPSPITKLGQDILWSIFSLNADMDEPLEYDAFLDKNFENISALDNVMIASQVCQSWRSLLLRSPSVWGRVVRLNRLSELGKIGRKEIMKRTGNAPLCIKGSVQGKQSNYFFLSELFQKDWSRMRKIDIRIRRQGLYDDTLWDVFLRPTPHLVSFKIILEGALNRTFSSEDRFLFAGEAPLLQELCTKNVSFTIQAPWIKRLRCLRLETAEFKG
ncbi:hypothetical protein CPB84DRAFT_1849270 [Gymnopilus junonius]|uniref:F-box domain-containing protein n=1 Tax=Gymnopilus junonius TaxID=109634 RepID=A0A9P5NJW3_GYMJU|nr:hypothetical protein CPB84DRAFT_1849270 [Gymnopilus junonius]